MDSVSKNVDDDGDSATKHILDYYKKYSQNKELPKYFSGTSVSYLPEIKYNVENNVESLEAIVKTDINILITASDVNKEVVNVEEPFDTSRASSVMSSRKLEWDNGADIGYDNCLDIKKLRKSSSLPVLTDLKQKKVNFDPQISNVDHPESQSSSDSNVKIVLLTYSSSSECPSLEINNVYSSSSSAQPEEKKITTSSSSKVDSNVLSKDNTDYSSDSSSKQRISQFANTLKYLKQKIGAPDAQSTPKFPEGRKSDPELFLNTPVVKKTEKSTKHKVEDEIKPSTSISEEILPPMDLKSTERQLVSKASSLGNLPVVEGNENVYEECENNHDLKAHIIKYRNKQVINLAVTKPMTVECIYNTQELEQKPKHEPVQMVTKFTTVGVQTDNITKQELIQAVQNSEKNSRNQSLLFFEYSESEKTNACSTQTNSDVVASNCDSFEFIKNSPELKNDLLLSNVGSEVGSKYEECKLIDDTELANIMETQPGNLRRSQKTDDLRTVLSDKNSLQNSHQSSKDFCLGDVISTSQLDNIGDDIERSIHLLQKLLKSKKYDPVTKKRYIKKIVRKITESKYLEESSTSSDLFFPKKSKSHNLLLPTSINTDTSDEKVQKAKSSDLKLPTSSTDTNDGRVSKSMLQSNIPWGSSVSEKIKLSPLKKKLAFKTFTQDFLPKQNQSSRDEVSSPPEIIPTDSRDTRKSRFTLTNNEFSVNYKSDDTQLNKFPSCEIDSSSLEKQYESSSTPKSLSYENWREDKTLSEKLLEEKSLGSGDGDCLVRFAERERKYQINWINNEISHLGKLKGLLEKPKLGFSEPNKVSQNVKKTTTVYMVSEESDHGSKKSKKSKRNFVIETQLGAQISSDMCYKLGDTKYTVQELNVKKTTEPSKTRQILGDINVVSGDSTTNIKVTTFCESCKRAPCICDVTKSSICQICKSTPCICPSSSRKMCSCGCVKNNSCRKCKKSLCETANTSSTESVSSRKTICLNCHRATCICSKIESGLSTISKKCSIHEESPCHCIAKEMVQSSPSDEYTGTFIPAILPKSAINGENMKFSTFPYAAKDKYGRKQNIKSSDNCSLCGKNPCVCAYLKKDFVSSAISKNVLPRQHAVEIQSGSLKRVFENCCCTTQMAQAKCHCDFVQKLINHFDISDIPSTILKDLNYYDNKNSQTEESKPKCACQHVGIQTQMEIKHQNLQTLCDIENKVSQTDDCLAGHDCKHVGVQTHTNMKHQISQGSNCNMVQNTTSQYCQPEQTLYEYQATQTELVKYTSGDDEHKKGVYFAENVMDCMKSCEKQEVVCTCGSTQIDSDLLQSCSSKPTSSSCSKCNNADTKRDVKCTCKHTLTDSIPHIKKQVEISTSVNRKEQFRGKTDSLETNTIYEMSSKSTSLIVSSYETDISESPCEDSTSKSPTLIICVCCKEKHAPENICMQGSVNKNYPLCKYCVQRRPILTAHCYAGPEHVCTCYKPVRANILHEIKKTVNDLHNLEHCMCINPGLRKNMPIQYCTYCQFRLGQNFRSKKGIAYTLTLENESPRKLKSKRKRKKPALEEIRIKVPYSYNKKKCKDKENFSRKDSAKEKMRRCTESVTVNNSCPKDSKIKMNKTQKCRSLTLQEYLKKNKPEFIDSAEYRRQSLIISRSERELSKEEVKLRFFEDNIHNSRLKKQKLFTEKEMKEITKRNYRKLPEIRERVNNMKEQKLRSADKFIADIFTRKIQDCVLKGKRTFPLDRNIIVLPKT